MKIHGERYWFWMKFRIHNRSLSSCHTQRRTSSLRQGRALALLHFVCLLYPPSGALPWDKKASPPPSPETKSGVSIVNGNWVIDRPGIITAVGTQLTYQRPNEIRSRNGESITAPGPLTEDLHVYLIYQQPGPSVYYEYSMPLQNTHPTSEPHTPSDILPLVQTVRPTGPGEEVNPGDATKNDIMKVELHPNRVPSDPGENSNPQQPTYTWTKIGHTACSTTCGTGQDVAGCECVDSNCGCGSVRNFTRSVSDPRQLWDVGEWSECSRRCGPGDQHRQVICRQVTRAHAVNGTETAVTVAPEMCGLSDRPVTKSTCQLKICSQWEIRSEWSPCSVPCGVGQRSREVVCLSNQGDVEDDGECNMNLKPETLQNCDMGACARSWFSSLWSQRCSAECGNGTQTRSLVCIFNNNGLMEVVDEFKCSSLPRPITAQPCRLRPCGVQWYVTDWSACSRSCSGGYRVREVRCLADNISPSDRCDPSVTPESQEECNKQPCLAEINPSCGDQYHNCMVVVQARLCIYPYYRSVCCASCSRAHKTYPNSLQKNHIRR
ncbi:Thrombospondin type-1 domain-containing protein 4 A [Collichthys lucidus]|uniref:Thrombospondin type-1 domain-containing protein 4 A n=1 Tax=Collichthys lucidus TaxID=240159 RepID=A0A4U5U2W7_COLLU|nr:Thrombospondin type-1 domain-containing protein 4 A [Collichthys lucidus]